MWETPDNPERYPVRLFLKYRDEPQCLNPPFYLSILESSLSSNLTYTVQSIAFITTPDTTTDRM